MLFCLGTFGTVKANQLPQLTALDTAILEITKEITVQVVTETPTATYQPIQSQSPILEPTGFQVFLLVTATPDFHQLPPSLQIGKVDDPKAPVSADDAIDRLWPWLVAREREYFEMTGRYCQMLPSHISAVSEGAQGYPDGWYSHPRDQQYSWEDLKVIQYEPLPFAIRIDVYDGIEGKGFVACFTKGDVRRCKNYGPEAMRNTSWFSIKEESWLRRLGQ